MSIKVCKSYKLTGDFHRTVCFERTVQTNKHGVKLPAVLPRICLTTIHFQASVWDQGLPAVTSQVEKINTSLPSYRMFTRTPLCCFYSGASGKCLVTTVWPRDEYRGQFACSVKWYELLSVPFPTLSSYGKQPHTGLRRVENATGDVEYLFVYLHTKLSINMIIHF